MAALTGNLISDSYQGLFKTDDNGPITSTLKGMTDGSGNNTPIDISTTEVVISGSLEITGSMQLTNDSLGSTIFRANSITVEDQTTLIGNYVDVHGLELYSGSYFLDITVDGLNFGDYVSGTLLAVANNLGNPAVVIQLQNFDTWTDGTVSIVTPLQAQSGSQVTGSLGITGSLVMTVDSTFVLPLLPATTPVVGSAYFSGGNLYIYDGSTYLSASLA